MELIVISILIVFALFIYGSKRRKDSAAVVGTAAGRKFAFNSTRQTFLASGLLVADSHLTRMKGLLGTSERVFYGGGQGLWIVPCHGVHTFGMRYAIDVVYLDSENVVVHLVENVRPWRLTAIVMEAESVLELPARTASSTHTAVGDKIEIRDDSAGVPPNLERRRERRVGSPFTPTTSSR